MKNRNFTPVDKLKELNSTLDIDAYKNRHTVTFRTEPTIYTSECIIVYENLSSSFYVFFPSGYNRTYSLSLSVSGYFFFLLYSLSTEKVLKFIVIQRTNFLLKNTGTNVSCTELEARRTRRNMNVKLI